MLVLHVDAVFDRCLSLCVKVTGASSGIGRATALEFASRGASVVLGARRVPELEALVKEITLAGGKAVAVKLDVTDEKDQANIVKVALDNFGALHIAFNNAGIVSAYPLPATCVLCSS